MFKEETEMVEMVVIIHRLNALKCCTQTIQNQVGLL